MIEVNTGSIELALTKICFTGMGKFEELPPDSSVTLSILGCDERNHGWVFAEWRLH